MSYTHQGWLTENHTYFLLGDEIDELDFGVNSRTIVFDFTDLDNPVEHFDYRGTTAAIDHNGYVLGDEFYLANYTAGIRLIDISDIENKNMSETAYFDTYPQSDDTAFNGVLERLSLSAFWRILINDSDNGFFVVQKSN